MVDVTKVHEIVQHHGSMKEHMIAILLDCQEEYCYLPREVLEEVSSELETPLTSVLSIATFFRAFSLKPLGRHQIHGAHAGIPRSAQVKALLRVDRHKLIKRRASGEGSGRQTAD